MIKMPLLRLSLALLMFSALVGAARADGRAWSTSQPARVARVDALEGVLSASLAADRVVVVGRHGFIASTVDGQNFQQAAAVPTRTTLNAVHFVDGLMGWAVGHDGVILHSSDGGRHWQHQRQAPSTDEVLLGVWFGDRLNGLAVGMFGLALQTRDGGASWQRISLLKGDLADRHLYAITPAGGQVLLVAAENGLVVRSADAGATWVPVKTGHKASLWAIAAKGPQVVVVGLRGAAAHSADAGLSWQISDSGTTAALTAVVMDPTADAVMAGSASGSVLASTDAGRSFKAASLPARGPVTAIALARKGPLLLPTMGVLLPR